MGCAQRQMFASDFSHRASKDRTMKNRSPYIRAALLLLVIPIAAFMAQARFPQPNAEYHARRGTLRAQMEGPVVLFGYTSRQEGGEGAVFFQEESFYYFTGYDEPDAALLLLR